MSEVPLYCGKDTSGSFSGVSVQGLRLGPRVDFIRTNSYDKFSGSTKFTTHLDHISHGKTSPGTDWSNRCTNRVSIINTHRD